MGIIAKQSIKGALANYLGVLIGAVTTFFVVTDLLTQEEIGLTRVMARMPPSFASIPVSERRRTPSCATTVSSAGRFCCRRWGSH